MKKTIKYLGIATATLLAVSPVAAPALTDSVTTVKAATPTDDAINDVLASLKDESYSSKDFPNLLNSNLPNGSPYGYYGTQPADLSFKGGNSSTIAIFISPWETNNILQQIGDTSQITQKDRTALNNLSGVYVSTQIIGDDGKPIDLSEWNKGSQFINTVNNIKNIRDYGGSLKLKTTIGYNGSNYDKEYTLTNTDKKSANETEVQSAISEFKKNLKDVSNLRIDDGYPNLSNDMLNDYKNDADTQYFGQEIIRGYYANSKENDNTPFSSYDMFKSLGVGAAVNKISDNSNKVFLDNDVNIVLKAKDSNGNIITDKDTLDKMTQNNDPFKLDISFQYPDNGEMKNVDGKEVTFTPKAAMTNVTATYTDPVHVKDGSKVNAFNSLDSGLIFDSGDGDNATASKSSDDNNNNFYSSSDDAWNSLMSGDTSRAVNVGDTFDASQGTKYYQIVDATVPDEFKTFMNNTSMYPSEYTLSINGNEINNQVDNDNMIYNSGTDIYFIREIQVDKASQPSNPSNNNNSNNNQSAITGVATTHTDKGYYALYNDDNKKVDNRALVKNSSWKVDQVRTINGVKQYRVSTHEWVNASDVDFNENGEVTEGLSVQNLDKVKKIDLSTRHNHYGLYNSKKKVSTNRALAGGTSWLVDKIGTDSNGNTYYGVSTDEYVKADDGVNISK